MKKFGLLLIIVIIIGVIFFTRNMPQTNPSQKPAISGTYVAMGDSVAAGVGLKDDSDSSACDRTNQSYPFLVAQDLHFKLINLSCSGATLSNGILGSQNVNQLQETPQIEALFAEPKPTVITITIGANDTQWTTILSKCYTGQCGTAADDATIKTNLATVQTNLNRTLSTIQERFPTNTPKVLVTGYHQVFPVNPTPSCSDLNGIDATEIAWGRSLQDQINTTVQQAVAAHAFARYVPIDFNGHELCTADSWLQSLNDAQPYHPTAQGQKVYAKAIENALKGLQ